MLLTNKLTTKVPFLNSPDLGLKAQKCPVFWETETEGCVLSLIRGPTADLEAWLAEKFGNERRALFRIPTTTSSKSSLNVSHAECTQGSFRLYLIWMSRPGRYFFMGTDKTKTGFWCRKGTIKNWSIQCYARGRGNRQLCGFLPVN